MNAVITGATKGIGRATALKFASQGFDIAFCARTKKDVEKFQSELNKKFPAIKVISLSCDLSKKKEAQKFAKLVLTKFKRVDVLMNNAGLYFPGQVLKEKDGALEFLMNLNLFSAYHLTRALVGSMNKNKQLPHGHIFNLCSVASIKAYPDGGSYAITKHALLGFSRTIREELKHTGIKVTTFIGGAIWSASWEGVNLPEERFAKAEDAAEIIWAAYNLSDRACVEEILIRPQLGDI